MKKNNRILILAILLLTAFTQAYAQQGADTNNADIEGEVILKTLPAKKNAIFSDNGPVEYAISVKNDYKVAQKGKFSYLVRTDLGQKVMETNMSFDIGANESKKIHITIPKRTPGFYNVDFRFNLSYYDDTVRRTFGVSPEKLKTQLHRPADFEDFWKKAKDTLAKVKPEYKVTLEPELSDADRKVYLVEMRSYGGLLIRGWLVIPKESYKQPVHYRLPGYVVGLNPNYDTNHFITFNLNVRGNGNSQDVINIGTEDYCYTGIEDKNTYIYKGVYMDAIRGLDFIHSHPELGLDTSKIYVEGSSQGGTLAIVTAALDKRAKLLAIQVPLFSDFRKVKEVGLAYDKPEFPIKFFTRYLNEHPKASWDKIFSVMDYYDPQNFAPMISCPVIMGIGLLDKYCPPFCSFSLYDHFASKKKEWYASPELTHEVEFNYYMLQSVWLGENFKMVY